LGEVLVLGGFLSPKELAIALSIQSGIPYVDVEDYFPDKEALFLIDKGTAESTASVVLAKEGNKVIVAIADPFNERRKSIIKMLLRNRKLETVFRLAEAPAIKKGIEKFYSAYLNPAETVIQEEFRKRVNETNFERIMENLLKFAVLNNVSDIHINPMEHISFIFVRIDGILQPFVVFPKHSHANLISVIKLMSNMNVAERRIPQDGSFSYSLMGETLDVRVSTLPTAFGEKVVMRILKKDFSKLNIQFLGYESFQQKLLYKAVSIPYGMVIVSGPTGSGKSTTLYSMLRSVNYLEKNVVTVEDPIEYRFNFIYQTEVDTSAGYKFATALKYFMRQDPDVILVGEIRDTETANISVEAANTGHLLISTIHANDALTTVKRLISLTEEKDIALSVLKFVISQRLIRKLCPFCKKEDESSQSEELLARYAEKFKITQPKIFKAVGCSKCRGTGYTGRTVVSEILEIDTELADMFSKGTPTGEIKGYLKEKGFITMQDVAILKVLKGITDMNEVRRVLEIQNGEL